MQECYDGFIEQNTGDCVGVEVIGGFIGNGVEG